MLKIDLTKENQKAQNFFIPGFVLKKKDKVLLKKQDDIIKIEGVSFDDFENNILSLENEVEDFNPAKECLQQVHDNLGENFSNIKQNSFTQQMWPWLINRLSNLDEIKIITKNNNWKFKVSIENDSNTISFIHKASKQETKDFNETKEKKDGKEKDQNKETLKEDVKINNKNNNIDNTQTSNVEIEDNIKEKEKKIENNTEDNIKNNKENNPEKTNEQKEKALDNNQERSLDVDQDKVDFESKKPKETINETNNNQLENNVNNKDVENPEDNKKEIQNEEGNLKNTSISKEKDKFSEKEDRIQKENIKDQENEKNPKNKWECAKNLPFEVQKQEDERELRNLFKNMGGQLETNKPLSENEIRCNGNTLEKKDRISLLFPIMLLALQKENDITDLHSRILGAKKAHIQGRINQVLQPITINDLIDLYLKYEDKFNKFFGFGDKEKGKEKIQKSFNFLINILKDERLIFNFIDSKQSSFYFYLYSNFLRLTGNNFSKVRKKNIEENIQLYFFPEDRNEKLEYRLQFTYTEAEGRAYYKIVTRLLVTKIIKPDYKDFMPMVISNLPKKGLNLIMGPTNSGKSSSIFRQLTKLHKKRPNAAYDSVEKPIEKTLDFVNHHQVYNGENEHLDYDDYLDAQVRSDGDVVFLGEIRNAKDLNSAVQLSNVGYTLFSTLHGNSIMSYKSRIRKWGNVRDALVVINNLITQQLFPTYKKKKLIADFNPENNPKDKKIIEAGTLIQNIHQVSKGQKPSPVLNDFYRKCLRYKPTVENNEVVGLSKRKDFLEAIDDVNKFGKYLANNFYLPYSELPDGMSPLFEYLQMNDDFVNAALKDKEIENYILTPKNTTFIPHFLNSMLYFNKNNYNEGDKVITFDAIENLAGAYN